MNDIHDVIDDQCRAAKGKMAMIGERFRAVKIGVNDMLDFARTTYNDMFLNMTGCRVPLLLFNDYFQMSTAAYFN